jgi:hypothetical protein
MNKATLTSKTGLTSIFTLIATGFGMYTGAVPVVAGGQAIVTGLLALFLRDSVETATQATEANTRAMAQQTIDIKTAQVDTPKAMRFRTASQGSTIDEKGGA